MQDLYLIDLAQIENRQADEQNPITLHYGHHYFADPKDTLNPHRRVPTDATSAKTLDQHPPPQPTAKSLALHLDGAPSIPIGVSKKTGPALKILSLQQLKQMEKKERIIRQRAKSNNSFAEGEQIYKVCQREQGCKSAFIELGGSGRRKSAKKISLCKYLQLRSKQIFQQSYS